MENTNGRRQVTSESLTNAYSLLIQRSLAVSVYNFALEPVGGYVGSMYPDLKN